MSIRNLFASTPAKPAKTDPEEFPEPGYDSDASDDYDDSDFVEVLKVVNGQVRKIQAKFLC